MLSASPDGGSEQLDEIIRIFATQPMRMKHKRSRQRSFVRKVLETQGNSGRELLPVPVVVIGLSNIVSTRPRGPGGEVQGQSMLMLRCIFTIVLNFRGSTGTFSDQNPRIRGLGGLKITKSLLM